MAGEDFKAGSVTVTAVNCSRNLRHARVMVSIFGSNEERQAMLKQLVEHNFLFQRHINKTLRLKYTPVLNFVMDDSLERGDHVLSILSQLAVPPEAE